jgi:hypothetical protein
VQRIPSLNVSSWIQRKIDLNTAPGMAFLLNTDNARGGILPLRARKLMLVG